MTRAATLGRLRRLAALRDGGTSPPDVWIVGATPVPNGARVHGSASGGPPVTEIAQIHAGNPGGIVTWARAPGKKRADAPQMPDRRRGPRTGLRQIAQYMLEAGAR